MQWWHYLLIFLGLFALFLLTTLVLYLLMKRAQKKAYQELEKLIPYEQNRFSLIQKCKEELETDGRFLPKNFLTAISEEEKLFEKAPLDLSEIKGRTDFLVMYLRKYLKEKKLLSKEKYQDFDKKLETLIFIDPGDKNSPYYLYNKKASHYNAFLGMMFLSIFGIRNKNQNAPII